MSTDPETPADAATPEPPAPASRPRRRWLRRLFVSLGTYLLGVLAVLGLVLGSLGWLFTTEAGTSWLLQRVPVLQVSGTRGALFGDFHAQHVELPLPGEGARLQLHDLAWREPGLHAGGLEQWLRISLAELRVGRVELSLSSEPSADIEPPRSLALPLGLDIALLRIDELRVDGMDTPVRDLRARLSLGADDGAYHRIDDLQLAWDRLHASARAQVGTRDGLPLQAHIDLAQSVDGDWQAALSLNGPLAAPQLDARLRAGGTAQRPAQALDATAVLKPFAAWPIGELQASARALDLAALHGAAPATALDLEATVRTQAAHLPAAVTLRLDNRAAGRWNEGRLPLRGLRLELQARPDEPSELSLNAFDASLGSASAAAGRISGQGSWRPAGWQLNTQLQGLRPAELDARAPAMQLDGALRIDGNGFDGGNPDAMQVQLRGRLDGRLLERGPAQPVQVRLDARLGMLNIELRELLAQAGGATATLAGRMSRSSRHAGWALRGQAALSDFDPQPWWPGREDSPWRQGPHRLNGQADFDFGLPAGGPAGTLMQQLTQLRGTARLTLAPSQLAGVPIQGSMALQTSAAALGKLQLQLDADGNRLQLDADLGSAEQGAADRWQLKTEMPALNRLKPLWRLGLPPGDDSRLAGAVQAQAKLSGRWPTVRSEGTLQASGVQLGSLSAKTASARWQIGSAADAPLDLSVELAQLAVGKPSAESLKLQLKGSLAAHTLELHANANALPPAWLDKVQAAPAGPASTRTQASLMLQGGTLASPGAAPGGWRGQIKKLELRGDAAGAIPWISSSAFDAELHWAGGPWRAKLGAGRATLAGAGLSWSQLDWRAADPGRAPAQLEAQAQLDPMDIAPLLQRLQPSFGWGGDLRITGHVKLKSTPNFSADIVVERSNGDLSVTDDAGTRWLGLSDLRFGLIADGGVWSFSTGVAGKTLGEVAGAVVATTSPRAIWPPADTPIQGVLELRIGDVGVWGPWLPPGWRLNGAMHASAALDGRFGAPEVVGEFTGTGLGVRNLLQGVEVRDGTVSIKLLGDTARIERFTAKAGDGSLELRGKASLGAEPSAELTLTVEQFRLLGRVDRRIVTSGEAVLRLGRETLALDGDFKVDEGLIDFSRSDAPTLSSDVQVVRGESAAQDLQAATTPDAASAARARRAALNLRVDLGENLRLRGQGLDTGLRGELRLSAPVGRLRVDGSVRTVGGTYRAYRQRLNIERGVLTFNGPVENPQLDIEAIRPNLDVRVGVAVTGTALVPRVRLFSEPDMSDAEKLSWLLRGRASEGQGSGDTALLQAAALALLAGDEPSVLDQLFNVIGLDDLSLRQSDSAAGGAIVSVGKQLSRNWYVGYERGLNATTGNWQLIYRIAQRFTVRAQSGEQNSIELIWTWRWQ